VSGCRGDSPYALSIATDPPNPAGVGRANDEEVDCGRCRSGGRCGLRRGRLGGLSAGHVVQLHVVLGRQAVLRLPLAVRMSLRAALWGGLFFLVLLSGCDDWNQPRTEAQRQRDADEFGRQAQQAHQEWLRWLQQQKQKPTNQQLQQQIRQTLNGPR
jgi:hypothetical protein